MSELLLNHLAGRPQAGVGPGTALIDPVLGTELARVDAAGLDLAAGFAYAREEGGAALRALTYAQRGALLAAIVKVLQANRDRYYEISTANSGTVKNDTAVDVDGGIYTLGTYAKIGESLGRPAPPSRWRTGAPGQGRRLPVAARAGADARRGAFHQRIQLPELGLVGKGRPGAAVRACR